MRDRPADLRPHSLDQHFVGDQVARSARARLVDRAEGTLSQIAPLPHRLPARLAGERQRLVAQPGTAGGAAPRIEQRGAHRSGREPEEKGNQT